jgi:hypothetical protein
VTRPSRITSQGRPGGDRRPLTAAGPPEPAAPGVTRLDLLCNDSTDDTAQALVRRWCEDRAVPVPATNGIVMLVRAAVAHGLRFDPRTVGVGLRWLDPDRVLVDLRCRGCAGTAVDAGEQDATAAVFDACAEAWGVGTSASGPTHWFVVDTRT